MKAEKDIADVLAELSQLYEFYKELKSCRFKQSDNSIDDNKLEVAEDNSKYLKE